jgi:maltooligosyltrehalose trehalohydrolase
MKKNLNLSLGALPLPDGNFQFKVWAPKQANVMLELVESDSKPKQIHMKRDKEGNFSAKVSAQPGTLYYYCFSDQEKYPDPASRFQPQGVFGPSALIDNTFNWTDQNWKNPPLIEYVIYELHVGTFSKEGSFSAIIPHLKSLRDLGITAIELMPVAQFSGERNWGYDGVLPFAVQNSYGGPDGLRNLVNACHQLGLAVILDVVYNHIGPEGNILNHFGHYFTDFYRTPWGNAINFDGAQNHHVRRYFIENALHWSQEYHIDALRLDALHAIYDNSASPFLRELAEHCHTLAHKTGKPFFLIAESDLNDIKLIAPKSKGGYGLDAQWNDDYHHALHTLLTQENNGYYQDFGKLADFAKAWQQGYIYSGQYSTYRQKPHGNSSKLIPADKLVVFAQNHDQIGNRLKGDRLTQHLSWPQLKLAAGMTILSPNIPLIFMGEEYGEPAPFCFFTSFSDKDLIEAVRMGRQNEFSAFAWAEKIPDPQSPQTYLISKLQHHLKQEKDYKILYDFYQNLIRLRNAYPSLFRSNRKSRQVFLDNHQKVICVIREYQAEKTLLVFHFNPVETEVTIDCRKTDWVKVLDAADKQWGGEGDKIPEKISGINNIALRLPAFGLVLFSNKEIP